MKEKVLRGSAQPSLARHHSKLGSVYQSEPTLAERLQGTTAICQITPEQRKSKKHTFK